VTEQILQGPFLTRSQAARRARVPAAVLANRPDLLRLGGNWLQEVYFSFQFDETGVVPEVGAVVQALKGEHSDLEIADWLVRPSHLLSSSTPLGFLRSGGEVDRVIAAADRPETPVGPPDRGQRPTTGMGRPAPPQIGRPTRRRVRRVAAWQS